MCLWINFIYLKNGLRLHINFIPFKNYVGASAKSCVHINKYMTPSPKHVVLYFNSIFNYLSADSSVRYLHLLETKNWKPLNLQKSHFTLSMGSIIF